MQSGHKCWHGRWACGAAGLAVWISLGASMVWAHGDGYLRWVGPSRLRFLTLSDPAISDSWTIDNDPPQSAEPAQTNAPAVPSPSAASTGPSPAIPPPDPSLTNPPAPPQSPPVTAPNVTAAQSPANPVPGYEFVLPDSLPGASSLTSTPAVTNTIGPASEMLLVTPQMLVDFFKPMPGATNAAPVRVLVPVDIGFQPPLASPAPPSRAIYRSP